MQISYWHESRQALGGDVTVVLAAEASFDVSGLREFWRQVFIFERQFSRFLPDSELTRCNNQAGAPTVVSDEFRQLLQASLSMAKLTSGLYNPFILPALQRGGYVQSAVPAYAHEPVADYRARSVVNPSRLELRGNTVNIPYGTALDMGGCGKGYLADQLAALLRTLPAVRGFWVSLSGDMVTEGLDADGQPWATELQSARDLAASAPYSIQGEGRALGIATSGTFPRPGQQSTLRKHHIIDPRTGQPADTDIQLATVIAPTALLADVLASCAVIVGSNQASELLKSAGALGAILQTKRGTTTWGRFIHAKKESLV